MCLTTVEKKNYPPDKQIRVGYKVLLASFNDQNAYLTPVIGTRLRKTTWNRADSNFAIVTEDGTGTYPSGFHIFLRKKDAIKWSKGMKVKKVIFKDIVAEGQQFIMDTLSNGKLERVSGPCAVARCMKIVPDDFKLEPKVVKTRKKVTKRVSRSRS